MRPPQGRSALFRARRWLGVGTGVLAVTLAAGARGPVTGQLDAFLKTPTDLPMPDAVLPEVADGVRLPVERPTKTEESLADQAVGSLEIPAPALRAYRNAEAVMRDTSPSCNLTWEILAGIGRVESDHGRFGGAVVGEDGVPSPPIYGVALNGVGDVAAISDTDGGELDGDSVWDRAVGPMQFLPTTWELVGVDADQDGEENPQDLDDAALAAAIYLCAGDTDLSDREQLREALYRYNPSDEYVELVLSYIDAYRNGDPYPVESTSADDSSPTTTQQSGDDGGPTNNTDNGPSNNGPSNNGPSNNGPSNNGPSHGGGDNGGGDNGGGGNGGGNGGGGNGGGDNGGGDNGGGDNGGGDNGGGDNGGGDNGGGDEDPPDDPVGDTPSELTGTLRYIASTGEWRLVDAEGKKRVLYVGTEEVLARISSKDYDNDQNTSETVRDELMQLVRTGTTVTLRVSWRENIASVCAIDGKEYPPPPDNSGSGEDPTPPSEEPTEPTPSAPSSSPTGEPTPSGG